MTAAADKKRIIRQLNDALRTTFRGGSLVITAGVKALPHKVQVKALIALQRFDRFTEDNDPHGEHDFGNFQEEGHTFFFKIDYYNPTMDGGSEDPGDPDKTIRVLTFMLAADY